MNWPRSVPLDLFGIPFGLADCWLVASTFGLASVTIGRVLAAVAVSIWIVGGVAHLRGIRAMRPFASCEISH